MMVGDDPGLVEWCEELYAEYRAEARKLAPHFLKDLKARVSDLVSSASETIRSDEIEAWQATYDVETWEELEQTLADGDLANDELRGRRDVITRWEENLKDHRLIKHTLALYSDVEAAREQMTDDSSSRRQ